jgi:hypothetical protein
MKIRIAVERIINNLLGLDDMARKIEELNSSNKEASQRLDAIEKRMVESTRAVATLALVQANLIKELGEIANNIEEKESSASKSYVRKTSTDFTN